MKIKFHSKNFFHAYGVKVGEGAYFMTIKLGDELGYKGTHTIQRT